MHSGIGPNKVALPRSLQVLHRMLMCILVSSATTALSAEALIQQFPHSPSLPGT
jgi:hypothetical protein